MGIGDFVSTLAELRKQPFDLKASEDVPVRASPFAEMLMTKGRKVSLGGISLNRKFAIRNASGAVIETGTEAAAFPSPGFQSGVTPVMTMCHLFGANGWTGHAVAMGNSAEESFQRAKLQSQGLDDLREKFKRIIARLLMWSGTFILGTTAAASGTTGGYITLASGSAPINFFEPGDFLTIRSAATSGSELLTNAATGAGRILQVQDDLTTPRIILTDATGLTAGGGDYISWRNMYDTVVPDGIRSMVGNTGTHMGLDRATGANAAMRGFVWDRGGATLGVTDPDYLRDSVAVRAELRDGGYSLQWVGSHSARRSFTKATSGQVRFAGLSKQELGTPNITVNDKDGEKEFIADSYMIEKEVYVVDPTTFLVGAPEGQEGVQILESSPGNPVYQLGDATAAYDKYRTYATCRLQFGNIQGRFCGKMTNFVPAT